MAKVKISEFSSNPALNTDIDSINIAEGCAPSGINDAIRELMSQLKDWQSGTSNDPYVVGSSGSLTLNQGTANGVAYLNGSKVVTSGSALTYNGTTLQNSVSGNAATALANVTNSNSGSSSRAVYSFNSDTASGNIGVVSSTWNVDALSTNETYLYGSNGIALYAPSSQVIRFLANGSEGMRLTSTGLGIGTSSPAYKLQVIGASNFQVNAAGTQQVLQLNNSDTTAGTQAVKLGFSSSGTTKASINAAVYGNDYMTFNVGSDTERMRIDASGNLGIGTSSPAYKLDVQTSAGRFQVQNYGAGSVLLYSNGALVYNAATVGHQWQYAGTEQMRLDSSGNLGLGVTPSAWATLRGLQNGRANLVGYVSNAEGAWLTSNAFYDGSWKYQVSSQATHYQQLSGVHSWHTAPSGTVGNPITFTQAMTLTADGNLGIGTTSPSNRLVVGSVSDASNFLRINSSTVQTVFGSDASGGYVGTDNSYALRFFTNNTERARITNGGNILFGGTTTLNGFGGEDVTEFQYVTVGGFCAINSANANAPLYVSRSASASTGTLINFATSGSPVGSITTNGANTAYNTSSDYRLKNTIAPMTGALAKVAQLKPCTYKWNADGSDGEGFIAHELAEVVPQCVTGEKDAVDENGNPKYQGIDTSFLVATLTAAIQELKAEFDAYKASHP